MSRRDAMFAAIRPYAPSMRFTPENVKAIDALADAFGLERAQGEGLQPSRAAFESIKRWESCELNAYPDPGSGGDPWTIGWGAKGTVWTQEQADARLREDVQRFADGVSELLDGAPTTQGQFDALVSFAYNVGLGNLKTSALLKKHKAGDYSGAAAEFGRWNKAGGKVLSGLVKRRVDEAALYREVA